MPTLKTLLPALLIAATLLVTAGYENNTSTDARTLANSTNTTTRALTIKRVADTAEIAPSANRIFQVETYQSLASGHYNGDTTLQELIKHGDFGLGTLNGLAGEMVVLNGKVYQGISQNNQLVVRKPPLQARTPFAAVTKFVTPLKIPLPANSKLGELQKQLTAKFPSSKNAYAIKIHGDFYAVSSRRIAKQHKPYKPLDQVTKIKIARKNVTGTLVGFWFPKTNGVAADGFHFHFISKDQHFVGHVLDAQLKKGKGAIQRIDQLDLQLPLRENLR